MTDLTTRLNALEESTAEQIKSLRSELAAMKGDGVWRPSEDDLGYILINGNIEKAKWIATANYYYALGQSFRTEADGLLYLRNLRTHQRLKEMAGEWKPDLRDDEQQKWFIVWDISSSKATADYLQYYLVAGCVYFDSKEAAQAAIDAIGIEDLKAYLLNEVTR